jgi:hypothetical protein
MDIAGVEAIGRNVSLSDVVVKGRVEIIAIRYDLVPNVAIALQDGAL